MVKRIHLIVLLVLLQAVTGVAVLYAQSMTSASGIVKDSITGEPLAFVSVYFDGSTIGAMTFAVLPEPFTEQNGMVNSTMKIVRGKVEKAYASRIDHLYTPEGKNPVNRENIKSL